MGGLLSAVGILLLGFYSLSLILLALWATYKVLRLSLKVVISLPQTAPVFLNSLISFIQALPSFLKESPKYLVHLFALLGVGFGIVFRKLLFYSLVVLGATFVMYSLMWAAPGDLRDVLCPKGCDQELRKELTQQWQLDEPLYVQYGTWLGKAVRFEFGQSVAYRQGQPVAKILGPAIVRTSILIFGASILTLLFSFFLWWRPISPWLRRLVRAYQLPWVLFSFAPLYILVYWLVMATSRIPTWLAAKGWLSSELVSYWIAEIGFLPVGGQQIEDEASFIYFAITFFLAMLILALGNNNLIEQASGIRSEIEHLQGQGFMRAVRARGASYFVHLSHNLLLPVIQFFATRSILLLGTVVIVETVMNITGVGWLLWEAADKRDTPLVLAIALFATVTACVLQMINEIALSLVDPRLREEK